MPGVTTGHRECWASRVRASRVAGSVIGIVLLTSSAAAFAQHGGGGGRGLGGSSGSVSVGRPDGVSEKDDLKDFHRAVLVQATADQRAAFGKCAQYADDAGLQLKAFRDSLANPADTRPVPERAGATDQAIAKARACTQNFLGSFSPAQKSGLKEFTNKLLKADGELDRQLKSFAAVSETANPEREPAALAAVPLDKELATFQTELLALGREMGVLLDDGKGELTFNLPRETNTLRIAEQTVSIPISGRAARTSAENGQNTFHLTLAADLSDVQQNLTTILRSQLTRASLCGERIAVRQATLTAQSPASLAVVTFEMERWVCRPGQEPAEMAGGEATLEVLLTPSLEPKTGLRLLPEISRVEAQGFWRERLREGDLGSTLGEQIAAVLLATMRKTADLGSIMLPPAVRELATLKQAHFEDAGEDQLQLAIEGQVLCSEQQTAQWADQLKQSLSAQETKQRQQLSH